MLSLSLTIIALLNVEKRLLSSAAPTELPLAVRKRQSAPKPATKSHGEAVAEAAEIGVDGSNMFVGIETIPERPTQTSSTHFLCVSLSHHARVQRKECNERKTTMVCIELSWAFGND